MIKLYVYIMNNMYYWLDKLLIYKCNIMSKKKDSIFIKLLKENII